MEAGEAKGPSRRALTTDLATMRQRDVSMPYFQRNHSLEALPETEKRYLMMGVAYR